MASVNMMHKNGIMSMLSDSEIEILISKLRNKYDTYAAQYSPRWFNKEAFEERLQVALRNKIDLEAFIVAEIAHFETLRKRFDEKKNERQF